MKLTHSSYTNGSYFRPKPIVIQREDSHLLVVATGWGPVELTQKAVDIVVEQFELIAGEDLTTPFEMAPASSTPAHRLVTGARLANTYLFRTENAKVWKTAVELTAIHYDHGVLSWVHVGSPHILLHDGKYIHPLAYAVDWVGQTGNQGPLFSDALGMEANVNLSVGSLRLHDEASLLLLSRSILPSGLLTLDGFDPSLVKRLLVDDNPEAPFWLGVAGLAKPVGRPSTEDVDAAEALGESGAVSSAEDGAA